MTNAPRQKGTLGEREVLVRLQCIYGEEQVVRTPPSSRVDIIAGDTRDFPIGVLYTRPNRGRWLVTLSASDFEDLLTAFTHPPRLDVEVKRHARFAHHTIYEAKFKEGVAHEANASPPA